MASPVVEVLRDLSAVLEARGIRWYLFGAQAAILHGASRLSADVDVTVDFGTQPSQDVVKSLVAGGFELRVEDVEDFIAKTRVIPIVHLATQMPADLVLAGPGLEEMFFERATPVVVEGVRVVVASAEDLIVMKLLAGRPKDMEDVAAVINAQGDRLDVEQVQNTLALLESALDQRDLLPEFERVLVRARPSSQ